MLILVLCSHPKSHLRPSRLIQSHKGDGKRPRNTLSIIIVCHTQYTKRPLSDKIRTMLRTKYLQPKNSKYVSLTCIREAIWTVLYWPLQFHSPPLKRELYIRYSIKLPQRENEYKKPYNLQYPILLGFQHNQNKQW